MIARSACEAIRRGRRLEVVYDGLRRIVEVHAVGRASTGNLLMRVWQVRGGSRSGERSGWKLLKVGETWRCVLLDEASEAPRPGYRRGDSAFSVLLCEVGSPGEA